MKDALSALGELKVWGWGVGRPDSTLAAQSRELGRRRLQEGAAGVPRATSRLAQSERGGRLLALAHGLPASQGGLLAPEPLLLELPAPRTQRRNFPRFLANSLLSGQPLPSPSYTLGGDFRVSR